MRRLVALCVLGLVAGLSTGTVGAAPVQGPCTPTPNGGGGPNRGNPPLRAKIGTGHVLSGVVLSPACKPVAGARVS